MENKLKIIFFKNLCQLRYHKSSSVSAWTVVRSLEKQVDAKMRLALEGGKKSKILNQKQTNQIKGGANPPCGFSLPISGLSFISGPWWGCHVDRPTSYYDNGSRGSTC